ncbi:MAG: SGNH/GDSL hydrolase family protein [Capsulimonadaceae bacterium]|nr:SGNH/GDSL hydrolase family protein [Capsulimonadaceae bacterium]
MNGWLRREFLHDAATVSAADSALSASEPNDTRRILREDIEWCDIWQPHTNEAALPRVILIGDSITRGYCADVDKLLAGKAYVSRIATSSSIGDPALIKQVELVMSAQKFDIVHFNNGMHGWDYTEEEYKRYFPELLAVIRKNAPAAKLIWGTITPVRAANNVAVIEARTGRVKARNAIAAVYAAADGIPIDDLYRIGEQHPEFYSDDGVHFNAEGYRALAASVAESIGRNLPAAR